MNQKDRNLGKIIKYWPFLIAIVFGLTGFGIFQLVTANREMDSKSPLTLSTIRTGDIRVSAVGSGILISSAEVQVGFEKGGVVEEILVETGDQVTEGDILGYLENEELLEALEQAEQNLREITSDTAIAEAALEIAQAQKAVLSAEFELRFLLSPYVFKAELRLQAAQKELNAAVKNSEEEMSDEADQKFQDAQQVYDNAVLSLALNWETYYEEYVPDFFNFPWKDRFGFIHDYYDPPSETEIAVAWADLAIAEARVEQAEVFIEALMEDLIPEDAYGTKITALEKAGEAIVEAEAALEASILVAPIDGMIIEREVQVLDVVGREPVMTIAQIEIPTIEAAFDANDWHRVKEGNQVEIVFDFLPEIIYLGRIVFVDPSLQTKQNTTFVSALVEIDISKSGWADLPLGSSASIEVIDGEVHNVVLLPIEALQDQQGTRGSVLVMNNEDTSLQQVELGLSDVLYVEIIDGLSAGDVVVIGNLDY